MGHISGEGRHPAPWVALRCLHLDDISTEISEQLGAIGPLAVREVQNTIWTERSYFLLQDDTSPLEDKQTLHIGDVTKPSESRIGPGGASEHGVRPPFVFRSLQQDTQKTTPDTIGLA
jgi:hypothetical protein